MRYGWAILIELAASSACGLGAGAFLVLGNRAFDASVFYLVLASIPTNLVAALAIYTAVRGGAMLAKGGGLFCGFLCLVNLFATLGVAAWSSGFLASGASLPGTHTFTWGMGFAYIEAVRDTRDGTWFGSSDE